MQNSQFMLAVVITWGLEEHSVLRLDYTSLNLRAIAMRSAIADLVRFKEKSNRSFIFIGKRPPIQNPNITTSVSNSDILLPA
jgi:hypothetical protein